MAPVRILFAPFILLALLAGCDKPQTPPTPKLEPGNNQQSVPETRMPAPASTQPNTQAPSSIQR